MRILHLVAHSHPRGAELVALDLAEELESLGHSNRVLALVPAEGGEIDPRLPPLVKKVRARWTLRAECTWRLRRLLAVDRYDVVLAHGGGPAQVAAFSVPRNGPLLVWQRILGFPDAVWHGPRSLLWRTVAARVDAAVALTKPDETEMHRLGFAGPVWVIPNFRRPERFLAIDRQAASAALREEIGVDRAVGLVGFVGHLVNQKRPERALDVLDELRSRGLRAHLVVAGDGPLRPRLTREVSARGLDESVTLLGHRNDVELVFGGVDVAVLTSDVEGMPGVVIEAQMAGCPVVSFPVGGVDEVLEDGVTGTVLARPDTTLMAEHVARLLEDPGRRDRMGEAARARAIRFTAGQSAAVYEAHLQGCVEESRHRGGRRSSGAGRRRDAVPLEERLPNLFILGAPKAGTTFVHEALRLAPGVYMSGVKEPGFFMSREYRLGLEHYVQAYFRGASGSPRRGESTPWYLYSDDARQRIAGLPGRLDPKLLVVVRRPADRALSMHRDQVRIGRESRSFESAVVAELDGLERGEMADDVRQRYVWCGLYAEHIRAWQTTFGPDAVEILVFEDLAAHAGMVWSQLSRFLAQDLGRSTFEQVSEHDRNPGGELRWPRLDRAVRSLEGRDLQAVEMVKRVLAPGAHRRLLQQLGRLNRQHSGDPVAVDQVALADLDVYFAAEHARIEALLGRPIDAWGTKREQPA